MKSLQEQMRAYGAYHQSWRNKLFHFIGVPLVSFSLFLLLGWFRFAHAPDLPLTAATLFYISVFVYYLYLDWGVALIQAPFTVALLWLADRAALLPFVDSLLIFAATFLGGSVFQLLGHAIEGKKPALTDNFLQVFNAPLFLTVEVLTALGMCKHLNESASPATFETRKHEAVEESVKSDTS
ncbi:MAG: DUF962 domain-containing protein [Gemmataceae bacterium]|nr:DUF962 domain-containing protein [Gemmataceae bacterium]MCI0742015.1 DUF962 domain-containing protein [Gemmataceae bacterium]